MKKFLLFAALIGTVYAGEVKEFSEESLKAAGELASEAAHLMRNGIPLPSSYKRGDGKALNPLTDICWGSALPIHIPGVADFAEKGCLCLKKGIAGFRISFWEPSAIIEVTKTPYKFLTINADFSDRKSLKDRGSAAWGDISSSFYQVHYIPFPLFRALALVPGFDCMKDFSDINPPWCTEWDPSWKYPRMAQFFGSKKFDHSLSMIEKCQEECTKIKKDKEKLPEDNEYWWCAGCLGSYYPLSGHVSPHLGGPHDSALLVHRILGKFHTIRSTWFKLPMGYETENDYCGQEVLEHFPKSFYKKQLLYPTPKKKKFGKDCCQPLGAPVTAWGDNLKAPDGREDFSYLVWSKRQCCFNVAKVPGITEALNGASSLLGGVKENFKNALEQLPSYLKILINADEAQKYIGRATSIIDKAEEIVNGVKGAADDAKASYESMLRDQEEKIS